MSFLLNLGERMRSEAYGSDAVCLFVCLSVTIKFCPVSGVHVLEGSAPNYCMACS